MRMFKFGRRLVLLPTLMVVVMLVNGCMTNPGSFTVTASGQSEMVLLDSEGSRATVLNIGVPQCSDGVDNDADGLIDESDDGCASLGDANERMSGAQTYESTELMVELDGDGVATYDPGVLNVQSREFCVGSSDASLCLDLTVEGIAGVRTVQTNTEGFDLPFPVRIRMEPVTGYGDLPQGCQIGPIESVFQLASYDMATGVAVFETSGIPVPEITTCGTWNDVFNMFLDLPTTGEGRVEATILNDQGEPPQFG